MNNLITIITECKRIANWFVLIGLAGSLGRRGVRRNAEQVPGIRARCSAPPGLHPAGRLLRPHCRPGPGQTGQGLS